MRRKSLREVAPNGSQFELPDGCPEWIDLELLAKTIETWQPGSEKPVSERDAVEILQMCGNLFEVVGMVSGEEDEK